MILYKGLDTGPASEEAPVIIVAALTVMGASCLALGSIHVFYRGTQEGRFITI